MHHYIFYAPGRELVMGGTQNLLLLYILTWVTACSAPSNIMVDTTSNYSSVQWLHCEDSPMMRDCSPRRHNLVHNREKSISNGQRVHYQNDLQFTDVDIPLFLGDRLGDRAPKIFGPSLLWPNGWMNRAGTWPGGRPRPMRHCVRRGPSCSLPKKGAESPKFVLSLLVYSSSSFLLLYAFYF